MVPSSQRGSQLVRTSAAFEMPACSLFPSGAPRPFGGARRAAREPAPCSGVPVPSTRPRTAPSPRARSAIARPQLQQSPRFGVRHPFFAARHQLHLSLLLEEAAAKEPPRFHRPYAPRPSSYHHQPPPTQQQQQQLRNPAQPPPPAPPVAEATTTSRPGSAIRRAQLPPASTDETEDDNAPSVAEDPHLHSKDEGDAVRGRPASARHRIAPILQEVRPLSARPTYAAPALGETAIASVAAVAGELIRVDEAADEVDGDTLAPPPLPSQSTLPGEYHDVVVTRSAAVRAESGVEGGGGDVANGAIAPVPPGERLVILDALRRSTLLAHEDASTLEALVDEGELRPLRRYATVGGGRFVNGGLAILIDGGVVRADGADAPLANGGSAATPGGSLASAPAGAPAAAPAAAESAPSAAISGGATSGGASDGSAPEAHYHGPGMVLNEEALMLAKSLATSPFRGRPVASTAASGRWQAVLPSHVLVIPPAALVRLQEAGRLTHATSLARVRVFTRCLRRLTSSVLRTVPTNTIALIAPLLELRMCHTGDPAPPPSAPDSLVIVVEGRIRASSTGGRVPTTHTPASRTCWCNESALLGRTSSSRTAVLPIAVEPSTVVVCPPEHFALLRAALPYFVAAAGSRALGALQECLLSLNLRGEDALRKVPELMSNADRPPSAQRVLDNWERLTRRLMPTRQRTAPTLSLTASDYPSRQPVNIQPQKVGNATRSAVVTTIAAEEEEDVDCAQEPGARAPVRMMGRRHSAFREAHGWKSFNSLARRGTQGEIFSGASAWGHLNQAKRQEQKMLQLRSVDEDPMV